MKAIFLPIRSTHACDIMNGLKLLELRTRIPNIDISKGIWVYGYVTKAKPYLQVFDDEIIKVFPKTPKYICDVNFHGTTKLLNGTIPFRFWFDEHEEVLTQHHIDSEQIERILKQACIEHENFDKYVGNKEQIYAWHIKQLEIFETPMQLSDFYTWKWETNGAHKEQFIHTLKRSPQSFQFVYVKEK